MNQSVKGKHAPKICLPGHRKLILVSSECAYSTVSLMGGACRPRPRSRILGPTLSSFSFIKRKFPYQFNLLVSVRVSQLSCAACRPSPHSDSEKLQIGLEHARDSPPYRVAPIAYQKLHRKVSVRRSSAQSVQR
jgi:hypothetical protein